MSKGRRLSIAFPEIITATAACAQLCKTPEREETAAKPNFFDFKSSAAAVIDTIAPEREKINAAALENKTELKIILARLTETAPLKSPRYIRIIQTPFARPSFIPKDEKPKGKTVSRKERAIESAVRSESRQSLFAVILFLPLPCLEDILCFLLFCLSACGERKSDFCSRNTAF